MVQQGRRHLRVQVGNGLEWVAAGVLCYGISQVWSVGGALIVAGLLLGVGAELVYDGTVWRFPLPRAPHPVAAARARAAVVRRRVGDRRRVRCAERTLRRTSRAWVSKS